MAEKQEKPKSKVVKKPLAKKKTQTVRERASGSEVKEKPKRIRKAAGRAKLPLSRFRKASKKEYDLPIPLPDNKVGRVLKKRVRIRLVPKFIREAFAEVRLVTWPNRKDTIRLTTAVFIFAVIFASIVGALDYVLGELFKRLIIKQ